MSVERSFAKAVAWMAAGSWIEQGCNMLFFILLARLLGAEAFGLAAMAVAFVIFAESLVRESLSEGLISEDAPDPGFFSAIFWMLTGLGAVLTLGLILAAGPIAAFYGEPVVRDLLIAFSPTVFLVATNAVPVAILRRKMQFKILSLRAIAGVVVGGGVGAVMAFSGAGVWALVAQQVTLIAVNAVIAWIWAGWRPSFHVRRAQFRAAFGFGGQVLSLRLAELIAAQTPIVLIGASLGPAALGFFSIAWRLIEVGSFLVVTPLRMASQSAFALLNRQHGDTAGLLQDISRLSSLVAFPAFLGLAVLARPLVAVLFGDAWAEAGPVLAVLGLVGLYLCIERVQQSFCLAAGKIDALTRLAWGEVILGVVAILIASYWGLVAVTIAFALRYYLLWSIRFRIVAGIGGLPVLDLARLFVRPAGLALVMACFVAVLDHGLGLQAPLARLVIGAGSGAAIFGLGTVFLMPDRIALLRHYLIGKEVAP